MNNKRKKNKNKINLIIIIDQHFSNTIKKYEYILNKKSKYIIIFKTFL